MSIFYLQNKYTLLPYKNNKKNKHMRHIKIWTAISTISLNENEIELPDLQFIIREENEKTEKIINLLKENQCLAVWDQNVYHIVDKHFKDAPRKHPALYITHSFKTVSDKHIVDEIYTNISEKYSTGIDDFYKLAAAIIKIGVKFHYSWEPNLLYHGFIKERLDKIIPEKGLESIDNYIKTIYNDDVRIRFIFSLVETGKLIGKLYHEKRVIQNAQIN